MKKLLVVFLVILCGLNIYAQEARFAEISGTVEVQAAGSQQWRPAAVGDIIAKNTVISTGIRSSAVISLSGSSVTVSPLTVLTLEELVQKDGIEEAALFVRTGRVRADVTPPTGVQAEFTVRSPTTTASVRGTSFSFDGRRIAVHSGQVSFANNASGQKVFVNANQSSYADSARQGRLATPLETDRAGFRSNLPDLDDIGTGKKQSQSAVTPPSVIIIVW